MRTFFRAQVLGIPGCRRLLYTLLAAPFLMLLFARYAYRSWLPVQSVLMIIASLGVTLSSEILHFLTIDEIKSGSFDILLISPIRPLRLVLAKLLAPVAFALGLTFVFLLANNLLAPTGMFTAWLFSAGTVLLLVFGAVFSALLEFICLLFIRRDNTNLHFFIIFFCLFVVIGLFLLAEAGYGVPAAVLSLTLLAVPLFLSCRLLEKRCIIYTGSRGVPLPRLFPGKKLAPAGAFFRKNLSAIRCHRHIAVKFVLPVLFPILGGIASCFSETPLSGVFMTALFTGILSNACVYFVYYSALYENQNKMDEILSLLRIGPLRRILEKAVCAGTVCTVLCVPVFFLVMCFHPISLYALPVIIACGFLSALLCSALSVRIRSFRGENLYKTLFSVICLGMLVAGGLLAAI